MKKVLFALLFVLIPVFAFGASITVKWDAVTSTPAVTGYRIYQSIDDGITWTLNTPVGNVLTATITVPDTGLVILRIGAVNSAGESIRYTAGAWYKGNMAAPPPVTAGLAIP